MPGIRGNRSDSSSAERQDDMADARRQQSLFMDSVKVIDTPVTVSGAEVSETTMTATPTEEQQTNREVFVPLNEIKGNMAVNLGTEAGQLIPQGLRRLPNGTYQITGALAPRIRTPT